MLDLDNTLIHSVMKEPNEDDQTFFEIRDRIFVYKRPHLEYFLTELHKVADVHLYTASHSEYAD